MKKLILSAIAATIVASPLAATAASAAPWRDRETTIVRHEPGRTVVTHRDVRYERGRRYEHAPVFRHRWGHERIVYRHGHPVRVTYRR